MTERHAKMVLGGFYIIRILLIRVISGYKMSSTVPIKQSQNAKKNLILVASMIYRAYIKIFQDLTGKGMPVKEIESLAAKNELLKKSGTVTRSALKFIPNPVNPAPVPLQIKPYLSDIERNEIGAMVLGTEPMKAMTTFLTDDEGLPHVREVLERVLQNLFVSTQEAVNQRKRLSMLVRLAKRRQIMQKISGVAPEYLSALKKEEPKVMQKYGLKEQDIQRVFQEWAAKNNTLTPSTK